MTEPEEGEAEKEAPRSHRVQGEAQERRRSGCQALYAPGVGAAKT